MTTRQVMTTKCKLGGSHTEQLGGAGLREGEGQADAGRLSRSLLGREEGKKKHQRWSCSRLGRQETSKSRVWANLAAEQEREEQRRPQTVGGAGSLQTIRQASGKSEGPIPEAALSSPRNSIVQPFYEHETISHTCFLSAISLTPHSVFMSTSLSPP